MKKLIWLLVILNFIWIIPKAIQNYPFWKKKLTADQQEFIQLMDIIKAKTPTNSIIVSRKPQATYFYGNRKSFCYPFTSKPDSLWKSLLIADYIIADNLSWTSNAYLNPILEDSIGG